MNKLRDRLAKGLLKIPNTQLNGGSERLCNNVNVSFHFVEGEALLMHLDMKGLYVSTASACSSLELKASHVLLALGLKAEVAHGTLRFTLSKYTTTEEIDATVKAVKEVVTSLRKISPLREGVVVADDGEEGEHCHVHGDE
jgi:cysteine desulfurase